MAVAKGDGRIAAQYDRLVPPELRPLGEELRQRLAQLKEAPASDGSLPDDWVKAFPWRCIGPATMGGRITAISAFDVDPTTYWIGTASGSSARRRSASSSVRGVRTSIGQAYAVMVAVWPT